jgi:hypothetical protein
VILKAEENKDLSPIVLVGMTASRLLIFLLIDGGIPEPLAILEVATDIGLLIPSLMAEDIIGGEDETGCDTTAVVCDSAKCFA